MFRNFICFITTLHIIMLKTTKINLLLHNSQWKFVGKHKWVSKEQLQIVCQQQSESHLMHRFATHLGMRKKHTAFETAKVTALAFYEWAFWGFDELKTRERGKGKLVFKEIFTIHTITLNGRMRSSHQKSTAALWTLATTMGQVLKLWDYISLFKSGGN